MTDGSNISAQLNLHPNDLGFVPHILPHQIRVWGPQVKRIHVTLDTHGLASGHYRTEGMDEKLKAMRALLADMATEHPKLVVDEVDYSDAARKRIARRWLDADDLPVKAYNGSPIYAYLYGMAAVETDYVVHFDGDMLFGGGSTTWASEAIARLESDPRCVVVNPFPGPPREDGEIYGHIGLRPVVNGPFGAPEREGEAMSYRAPFVSTRILVTGIDLLRSRLGSNLRPTRPNVKERAYAHLIGAPTTSINLERLLSLAITRSGCYRVDMLGSAPGMWSLHPLDRGPAFIAGLPALIEAVENDALPNAQRGRYDIGTRGTGKDQRLPARMKRWSRYGVDYLKRQLGRRAA